MAGSVPMASICGHANQVDVYRRFQHSLPSDCQDHLNALAENGWLAPHHINTVMRYLRDAKTYLAGCTDQLLLIREPSFTVGERVQCNGWSSVYSEHNSEDGWVRGRI